ncbi:MAG: SRPBCC domain-containing protein [Actinomycetota bacterium]|nr:SRPBCC domain-containing protein [Actinomycetota bacterium]
MTQQAQDVVLKINRRFEAPRERVFDAWTNPEVLREWWRAGPDRETPAAEVDLRPGGSYRLSMRDTEKGETHTVVGEYKEIQPPERLVYTWSWESNTDEMAGSMGSLVTVEFREDGGATEVSLTHTGFSDENIRDMHAHGWEACIANLERYLTGGRS